MRAWLVLPLLLVSACGSEGEEAPKSERPASLAVGQWELTAEVTGLESQDDGQPAIDTPVGTRLVERFCVGEPEGVPLTLFSGENYQCEFDNQYVRNGRINSVLSCKREGLQGDIAMTVDGNFEDDSLNFTRIIRTSLAADGDVQITQEVTGRMTGDCTPGEEAPAADSKAGGQ